MHFVIHWTLLGTEAENADAEKDIRTVLATAPSLELLGGLAIARPNGQHAASIFVSNMVTVEQVHDPVLDIAIFSVQTGSWYRVSEAVNNAVAKQITGREPDGP